MIGLSLTLHAGIGLLVVLGARPAFRFDDSPAIVAVVFEAHLPPAPALGPETAIVSPPPGLPAVAPQSANVPSISEAETPPRPELAEAPAPDQVAPPAPLRAANVPVPPPLVPQIQPPRPSLAETPAGLLRPSPVTPKPARPQPLRPPAKSVKPEPPPAFSAQDNAREFSPSLPVPATALPPSSSTVSSPARPPSASPVPSAIDEVWRSSMAAWVRSHQRYPEEARHRGEEGTVTVRFTVNRDGRVLDPALAQPGGSGLLEQAALAMFRDARAPAFPVQMAQPQVTITITLRYRLED